MKGRVLALDPGSTRIGVAVSDSARTLAFPRESVAAGDHAVAAIVRLVHEEHAVTVVVGRPRSLAGKDTASTQMADQFFNALSSSLEGVELVPFDERLTTVEASRRMGAAGKKQRDQRASIDSAAAVVLLQSFLDATN